MGQVERMWNTIEKARKQYAGKQTRYDITVSEIAALADYSKTNLFDGISAIFDLGFIRGVRWAEKQRRKEMEAKA